MNEREVKTRQTFDEWARENFDYSAPLSFEVTKLLEAGSEQAWNAALASVILPEGDWADELSKLVPWDKVRSTNVVICAYDQTGTQVAVFGKINRPLPKTVELTVEEKLEFLAREMRPESSFDNDGFVDIARVLANGKTLDQLCQEYDVATTRSVG